MFHIIMHYCTLIRCKDNGFFIWMKTYIFDYMKTGKCLKMSSCLALTTKSILENESFSGKEMSSSFPSRNERHFTCLPRISVRNISKKSGMDNDRTESISHPKLQCITCARVLKIAAQDDMVQNGGEGGKLTAGSFEELFAGDHDFHCTLEKSTRMESQEAALSQENVRRGIMPVAKLLPTVAASAHIHSDIPPLQSQRCNLSRLNAVRRKLRFYKRRGIALPSVKKLASVIFYDEENRLAKSSQIIIAKAVRSAMLWCRTRKR